MPARRASSSGAGAAPREGRVSEWRGPSLRRHGHPIIGRRRLVHRGAVGAQHRSACRAHMREVNFVIISPGTVSLCYMHYNIGPRARVATSFAKYCEILEILVQSKADGRRIVSAINQGSGRSRADVPQKNWRSSGASGGAAPISAFRPPSCSLQPTSRRDTDLWLGLVTRCVLLVCIVHSSGR